MTTKFANLHAHYSGGSLWDGVSDLESYTSRAAQYGHSAVCATDHGTMYSMVAMAAASQKHSIPAIYGEEVYINLDGLMTNMEKGQKTAHLTLLAENEAGFKNLIKLSSRAFLEGYKRVPRIDHELLTKHSEGIICLSGCLSGPLNTRYIKQDDKAGGVAECEKLLSIFGKQRFFLEVQPHSATNQLKANAFMEELARDYGLDVVCTLDSHYIDASDSLLHDVRTCISQRDGTTIFNNTYAGPKGELRLRTIEELEADPIVTQFPHSVINAGLIAERCKFNLELGKIRFPQFDCPDGFDSPGYLKYLTDLGFADRESAITKRMRASGKTIKEYLDRAAYELDIISGFGFADYFLIIADIMRYARERKIGKGSGRGSVCGSLAAYLLHITEVDSVNYNIPFERFINPGRAGKGGLPDIDSDFSSDGYDEIVAYVRQKYGDDRVGNILTFSRLGGRSAIKNVGKALGLSLEDTSRVSALVPKYQQVKTKFTDILTANPRLVKELEKTSNFKELCLGVEGMPKSTGIHPGGIVITPGPLEDHVPLTLAYASEDYGDRTKAIAVQLDKDECEKMGLVKMDLLRVDTVAIIKKAKESVFRHEGVDLSEVPTDDRKTFALIQSGDTDGIFQMGGPKFKRLLIDFKPESIEHLAIVNALVRPGAEAGAAQCIARRHGKEPPTPPVPQLEPVLRDTWGCLVFQDQMLKVCMVVAGMSWGDADDVRKAAGKKNVELMELQRAKFLAGATANGYTPQIASSLFDLIYKFSAYGFGLGHGIGYSVEGYETAYLKANYPAHFISAALNVLGAEEEKRIFWVQIAKRQGIAIYPPDINKSGRTFEYENGGIRAGLCAIRGVGPAALDTIELVRRGLDQKKLYGSYFTSCPRERVLSIEFLREPDRAELVLLHKILKMHPGEMPTRLIIGDKRIDLKNRVNENATMLAIQDLFGEGDACLLITNRIPSATS